MPTRQEQANADFAKTMEAAGYRLEGDTWTNKPSAGNEKNAPPEMELVEFAPIEFDIYASMDKYDAYYYGYDEELFKKTGNPTKFDQILNQSMRRATKVATKGDEFKYDSYRKFLTQINPGADELATKRTDNAIAFLNGEIPDSTELFVTSAAAEASNASGITGLEAGSANEKYALQGVQLDLMKYGASEAANIVAQDRALAQSFVTDPVPLALNMASSRMVSPQDAINTELDVLKFNATGAYNASTFNSQAQYQSDMNYWSWKQQKEAQRRAEEQAQAGAFGAIGSVLGTAAGVALALPTGGTSLLWMPAVGGALGGAAGTAIGGGNSTQQMTYGAAGAGTGMSVGAATMSYQNNKVLMDTQVDLMNTQKSWYQSQTAVPATGAGINASRTYTPFSLVA